MIDRLVARYIDWRIGAEWFETFLIDHDVVGPSACPIIYMTALTPAPSIVL